MGVSTLQLWNHGSLVYYGHARLFVSTILFPLAGGRPLPDRFGLGEGGGSCSFVL